MTKSFFPGFSDAAIQNLKWIVGFAFLALTFFSPSYGQDSEQRWQHYFETRVKEIESRSTPTDEQMTHWPATQAKWRQELLQMLGLNPLPERGELKPVVTGKRTREGVIVENLHFQSSPGLYVTANLYRPKESKEPLPTVLYLCGHGRVKRNGISYGNKVHYQHHGAWLAQNGYVCLIIDSLQLGEIEGIHHGTYRYDRWWWINRGYTSAGVEAWNCIRALDYLETRTEVDVSRIGCTGRSGGGAYSWWIAALDPRISVAVPVAGITDLRNHVIDDCVSGHCDCMYFVNQFAWDYPRVAQMVAPRPLMISNTDQDPIFPLDGVQRTYWATQQVYDQLGRRDHLGLNITPGPHQDTQELRVSALRWFNQHLKGEDPLIESPAVPLFEPEELKVFDRLPDDQINTTVDESFVPTSPSPNPPDSALDWEATRNTWTRQLELATFASWPVSQSIPQAREMDASTTPFSHERYYLETQPSLEIELHRFRLVPPDEVRSTLVCVLDTAQHQQFKSWLREQGKSAESLESLLQQIGVRSSWTRTKEILTISPRGTGRLQGPEDSRQRTQWRRKLYLLGETLGTGQAWDIYQSLLWNQKDRDSANRNSKIPVQIHGVGEMGVLAAYAVLMGAEVQRFELSAPPSTHREGPPLPNVRRTFDLPDALACLAEVTELTIENSPQELLMALEAYRDTLQQKFPQLVQNPER